MENEKHVIEAVEIPDTVHSVTRNWPESSNVQSTEYIFTDSKLRVTFNGGSVYEYFDVPKQMWKVMAGAKSGGKFIQNHIKGNYRYEKVSPSEGP